MALKARSFIPLARPDLREEDLEAVRDVLASGVLSQGPALEAFETAARRALGVPHAVAVSSGTAALHLLVRAAALPAGACVVTTPLSFAASVNVLLYEGLRPVFADVDPATGNLDPAAAAEAAERSGARGLLVVHLFGRPASPGAFRDLAQDRGWTLIEDACEAVGSREGGRSVGLGGLGGAFGFYPNKQIAAGEGGMVVTADEATARRCRVWRNQGRAPDIPDLVHEDLGYNYRLAEAPAALGASQMRRLEAIVSRREALKAAYDRRLSALPGVRVPPDPPAGQRVSWFAYVVRLDAAPGDGFRDRVRRRLGAQGIETRAYFPALHLQPYLRRLLGSREGEFPEAERFAETALALPFHPRLSDADLDRVAEALEEAVRRERRSP